MELYIALKRKEICSKYTGWLYKRGTVHCGGLIINAEIISYLFDRIVCFNEKENKSEIELSSLYSMLL